MDTEQYILMLEEKIRQLKNQLGDSSFPSCLLNRLNMPVLCTNGSYQIHTLNWPFLKLFHVEREKLLNNHIAEFFGNKLYEFTIQNAMDQCMKGYLVEHICLLSNGNGERRSMTLEYLPFYSESGKIQHVVILFKTNELTDDLTPADFSEWEDIVNAFQEGVYITNHTFEIKYASLRGQEVLSPEEKDLNGSKCYEIIHGTDAPPQSCPSYAGTTKRGSCDIEATYKTTYDGHVIDIAEVRNRQGLVTGLLHHFRPGSSDRSREAGREDLAENVLDRKIHDDFHDFRIRLSKLYPNLTPHNLTHCTLIRMNLSTDEIARYLNVNPTSIQRARVRLKKKLNLSREECLFRFLLNF